MRKLEEPIEMDSGGGLPPLSLDSFPLHWRPAIDGITHGVNDIFLQVIKMGQRGIPLEPMAMSLILGQMSEAVANGFNSILLSREEYHEALKRLHPPDSVSSTWAWYVMGEAFPKFEDAFRTTYSKCAGLLRHWMVAPDQNIPALVLHEVTEWRRAYLKHSKTIPSFAEFGERLDLVRIERGLSMDDLAQELDIEPKQVRRYIIEKKNAYPKTKAAFAAKLGVPVWVL